MCRGSSEESGYWLLGEYQRSWLPQGALGKSGDRLRPHRVNLWNQTIGNTHVAQRPLSARGLDLHVWLVPCVSRSNEGRFPGLSSVPSSPPTSALWHFPHIDSRSSHSKTITKRSSFFFSFFLTTIYELERPQHKHNGRNGKFSLRPALFAILIHR
jgi:hypothetical protein